MKENLKLGRFETAHGLLKKVKTVQVPSLNTIKMASEIDIFLQEKGKSMSLDLLRFCIRAQQALHSDRYRAEEDSRLRNLLNLSPVSPPVELLEDRLVGLHAAKPEVSDDPEMVKIIEKSIDITLSDIKQAK